ncbi:MAG TPA: hypothetical protein VFI21_11690 [Nocardioides sp.]|nr:hypothetical protein [Nocardioides sp.]
MIRTRPARSGPTGRALVGLLAAGLCLTGCGSSLGVHPGSAAVIGDENISMSKIDSTTTKFCTFYVAQSHSQAAQQQSGPLPMGYLRTYAATSLVQRALGEQLAAAYDVQPASGYQQQLSQFQGVLASTPADQRDAAIALAGADAYLQNVQVAIGQKLTGNTGSGNADLKAALARGRVATQDWLDDHDIFIDPVLGVSVDGDGTFTSERGQTSYPLSALAAAGAKIDGQQVPDDSYTSALPAAQVCG